MTWFPTTVKHNEANGENNRDGADYNFSWNHGVEGPTDDPDIEALRERQIKNFFAYTLLAMGTPMLQMGDEVRRTQQGNNNAYCQDNELSWFDWSLVEREHGLLRFVRELIRYRLNIADREDEGATLAEELHAARFDWHGVRLNQPDWASDSRSLAVTVTSKSGLRKSHFMFNTFWEPLEFELPPLPDGQPWQRLLDTSLPTPEDFCDPRSAPAVEGGSYRVASRSVVVLVASG